MNNKPKIIAVVGPTASGKTSLSVNVAKAFGGEVVSADSMQIYTGMDVATAKVTEEEMQGIKHHLVDFLSPDESFSVANYVDLAKAAVNDIFKRGNVPVIAGGTGLYVDSLINGTVFSEGEIDYKLRGELIARFESEGIDSLLEELKSVDYDSYLRLKDNLNPKRIIRAIEIYKTTGLTMTEQNKQSIPKEKTFDCTKIALGFIDRENLYNRINLRVDKMVESGLIEEAKRFFASDFSNTAVQAIGYKELKPYIDNEVSLDEAIESLKRATRRYAKRQLTWFKRDENTRWFYVDNYTSFEELLKDVSEFLISEGFELK